MAKDFRKKTFAKILRGYAPDEVHDYIVYINDEYRKLERKNAENERRLALALKKSDEMQKSADASAETSDTPATDTSAAESSAKILRDAAEKAEEIIRAAYEEAEKIRSDAAAAKIKADGVRKAASDMYDEVCSFRDSLFELYNSHIESIESITESAEECADRADEIYSSAVGIEVSRDDVDEDEDVEGEDEDELEVGYDDGGDHVAFDDDETADVPAQDIYIDLLDEEDEEVFAFEDTDADEDADDALLLIDWKSRKAVANDETDGSGDNEEDQSDDETRVLDLRAIREFVESTEAELAEESDFEDGEITVKDFAFNLPDDLPDDANDADGMDNDGDEDSDDDDIESEFGDLDFLFTDDKQERDFSLTDEFDIVFSRSDTNKNIDEIRRQPTVVQEEPKNKKKHIKF